MIYEKWWNFVCVMICYVDGCIVEFDVLVEGGGLNYEIVYFCDLLCVGEIESLIMMYDYLWQMIVMIDVVCVVFGVCYLGEQVGWRGWVCECGLV